MVNFPGCMWVLGRPIFQRPSRFRPTYGCPRPHTGSIGALKAKAAENFPPQKTGAMVGEFHFKMVKVGFIWHHFQVYDLMLVHDIGSFSNFLVMCKGTKTMEKHSISHMNSIHLVFSVSGGVGQSNTWSCGCLWRRSSSNSLYFASSWESCLWLPFGWIYTPFYQWQPWNLRWQT